MIEIADLCVTHQNRYRLKQVSLSVERGEIRGVLGPSGAGKTTLLKVIAGLERPFSGTVHLAGKPVSTPDKQVPPHCRNTSMVFQSLALWPHMNVRQQLEFVIPSPFPGREEKHQLVTALLDRVHLNGLQDRYPAGLSGGEQQRLAIARALAAEPQILLMDEPFSSLDHELKKELLDMVLSLKQLKEMTILYITHQIDEALYLADRITLMKQGRILSHIEDPDKLTRNHILEQMGWTF